MNYDCPVSCAWLQSFSLEDECGFESFMHRVLSCQVWVDDTHGIDSTFAQELKWVSAETDGSWTSGGMFLESSLSISLCEELGGICQRL